MAVGALLGSSMLGIPHFLRGLLSIIGGILIVIGLLDLGFAWGLWTGKGWAWILALIFAILGIIGSVLSLVRGGLGAIVILLLDAVIVYYLTRPNVKAFFGETNAPISGPAPTPVMAQPSTPPAGPARFCPNCGAPVTSDEKFCSHCGAQLP